MIKRLAGLHNVAGPGVCQLASLALGVSDINEANFAWRNLLCRLAP